MADRVIQVPFKDDIAGELKAGDTVLLNGVIFSARDAAHKRLCDALEKGEKLPVDLKGQVIYYLGPAPTPPGLAVGAAGPTSSYRMDKYTPALLDYGLKAMIGKGIRSIEVVQSMMKNRAVYFAGIGGAAVVIARAIKKCEVVCYEDLGPESVHRLYIERFPAVVAIDIYGNDQYKIGREKYCSMGK